MIKVQEEVKLEISTVAIPLGCLSSEESSIGHMNTVTTCECRTQIQRKFFFDFAESTILAM